MDGLRMRQCAQGLTKACTAVQLPNLRDIRPKRTVNATPVQAAMAGDAGKPSSVGICYLVGAGLGVPDLLTVRAARLLAQAEVVVYDDLGAQGLLDLAPSSAERIYVGKRGGQAGSAKQPDIDSLIVDLCRQGKDVVRLKGGCPSVFSRVGSELAALRQAGVPFTLVPGISSALAAPLLAGFPLTDVDVSTSFAVLTGHDPEAVDWAAFKSIPTLVILMGGAALPRIVTNLLQQGRAADTPVCITQAAGSAAQRVWRGQLGCIVEVTAGQKLSPCIIVVSPLAATPLRG